MVYTEANAIAAPYLHARLEEVRSHVELLSGNPLLPLKGNDIVLCSLIRNAAPVLPEFIEHHRRMGIKHIVLLDNGSGDSSCDIASSYADVCLLRCTLPFRDYKHLMRLFLCDNYTRGSWCLFLDADELFSYPRSSEVPISSLANYCESRGYSAVSAQMLDMLPDPSLPLLSGGELQGPIQRSHRWYDTSSMQSHPFSWKDNEGTERVETYSGGVRSRIFGVSPSLTKTPLFHMNGKVRPFFSSYDDTVPCTSHGIAGAVLADVTGVLLHFKLLPDFSERVKVAVEEGNYHNNSSEYREYLKILEKNPSLDVKITEIEELTEFSPLIDKGIAKTSHDYESFLALS